MTVDGKLLRIMARGRRTLLSTVYDILDAIYAPFVSAEEVIVVAGFPRSGTTFLAEFVASVTKARVIFEPISWQIPQAMQFLHPHTFNNGKIDFLQGFPYRNPEQHDPVLENYIQLALKGNVHCARVRRYRNVSSYRTKKVLVKTVRGNLLLAWIAQKFKPRVILLVRHPCAVVESWLRQPWASHAIMEDAFLSLFLDQKHLVEDWLLPYMDHIDTWDCDSISRASVAYCIANMVPLIQAQRNMFRPMILSYEDVVINPEFFLPRICQFLDVPFDEERVEELVARPSSTTQVRREELSSRQKCFSWQNVLETRDIDKIIRIVEGFGPPLCNILNL